MTVIMDASVEFDAVDWLSSEADVSYAVEGCRNDRS